MPVSNKDQRWRWNKSLWFESIVGVFMWATPVTQNLYWSCERATMEWSVIKQSVSLALSGLCFSSLTFWPRSNCLHSIDQCFHLQTQFTYLKSMDLCLHLVTWLESWSLSPNEMECELLVRFNSPQRAIMRCRFDLGIRAPSAVHQRPFDPSQQVLDLLMPLEQDSESWYWYLIDFHISKSLAVQLVLFFVKTVPLSDNRQTFTTMLWPCKNASGKNRIVLQPSSPIFLKKMFKSMALRWRKNRV